MRRIIIFSILLTNFAWAQQKHGPQIWKLLIVDNVTKKTVARATVSVNDKVHFIADTAGAAYIKKDLIKERDTVSISCIGYRSFSFIIDTMKQLPDSIRLSQATVELKEVKIDQLKNENFIVLGDVKNKPNTHRTTSPREKYVQYIPNEGSVRGTIVSVEFSVNDRLQGIQNPFKVGIYSKLKGDVFPGAELIKDTIIVRNPEKKHLVKVDISEYNIKMPKDGVFVAFETLKPPAYGDDFVWVNGYKRSKTPGIDMDLRKKGDYGADISDKSDRTVPYGMVMDSREEFSMDEIKYKSYVYNEGNDFAITIIIQRE
jgi:hypothetical protein